MANGGQRWAMVTGGNRGLGLETCRQLAQQGYGVVLAARDLTQAKRAAATLASASAAAVRAEQLDVTKPASVDAFAELVRAELGPLQALVNNAGIALPGFDENVVRQTLAVNFFGALRVTQALAPLVTDAGRVVMGVQRQWAISALTRRKSARASWTTRSAWKA